MHIFYSLVSRVRSSLQDHSKLLMGLVLGGLVLCVSYVYRKELHMAYLRNVYTFRSFNVGVGTPEGYNVVLDHAHTYVFDLSGKPYVHFGIWTHFDSTWGWGTTLSSLEYDLPLLGGVNIRWFSIVENQFYEARLTVDADALMRRYDEGEWTPYSRRPRLFLKEANSKLTINILPGGKAIVWLDSLPRINLLGIVQGTKINVDWQEFESYTFREPEPDQNAFRERQIQADYNPQFIRDQINTGSLPLDGHPWTQYLINYPWRLSLNSPYQFLYYTGSFFNGEVHPEKAEQAMISRFRSVPRQLSLGFVDPATKIKKELNLYYENEVILHAFQELGGVYGLNPMTIHVNYDMAAETVQLTINTDNSQVIIPTTFSVTDPPEEE